jgi:hypothetical protein
VSKLPVLNAGKGELQKGSPVRETGVQPVQRARRDPDVIVVDPRRCHVYSTSKGTRSRHRHTYLKNDQPPN